MRELRHVPPEGAWFEVTTRTIQSRYLIPTGEHFRNIFVGILARAKERHPVEIYAFGGLSNHVHLLIGVKNVSHLARFMNYVNSNIAREANRITGWREKFWGRRYRAIQISDEEAALVARLQYVLSHGAKENLVSSCREWPGLQCVDALTKGKPLKGTWYNRTLEYEASRRSRDFDSDEFATRYELELDPLPCWRGLSKGEISGRIRELVNEIDTRAEQHAEKTKKKPLGVEAIGRQDPHHRPNHTKKSPAPRVHAASRAIRNQMTAAYRLFEEAYRRAAARLRTGELTTRFPVGCFPPPQPFIPSNLARPLVRAGPTL